MNKLQFARFSLSEVARNQPDIFNESEADNAYRLLYRALEHQVISEDDIGADGYIHNTVTEMLINCRKDPAFFIAMMAATVLHHACGLDTQRPDDKALMALVDELAAGDSFAMHHALTNMGEPMPSESEWH